MLCNAQNQQFEINWKGSKVFSSGVSTLELPHFDARYYNYSEENGITFTTQWNAGFEINSQSYVSVGVDNLFDEDYFEHINRTNSPAITGFITDNTIGVKEPGRTVWLKAGIEF